MHIGSAASGAWISMLAILGALLPLHGAYATEGVIQINQARALEGGVTAGDTAGFPVTISASGSYVLTGDLDVPDTDTTAIAVTADWVTIDLNGFEIAGPNVCTWNGSGVDCTASSTGDGIGADSQEGLTVRNGTIRGMGDAGIEAGWNARVEHVTAEGNGGVGIDVGIFGYVARSAVRLNGSDGLLCDWEACLLDENEARRNDYRGLACEYCMVRRNIAVENGDRGIEAGNVSLVHDNVTEGNLYVGIMASSYSNLYDNTASGNGNHGIYGRNHSLIRGNVARQNASSGLGNSFDGTLFLDNTAEGNTSWGLQTQAGNLYGGNTLTNNGSGTAQGGTQLRFNLCGYDTICP